MFDPFFFDYFDPTDQFFQFDNDSSRFGLIVDFSDVIATRISVVIKVLVIK